MGPVDVQRAFHSMTVPPPREHETGQQAGLPVDEGDPVAVRATASGSDCPEYDAGCDECEGQARKAVTSLRSILEIHGQPLELLVELLEVEFDLSHGCAERLFWLAHERGYLSLREGRVYLGDAPTGPPANSMVEVAPGIR